LSDWALFIVGIINLLVVSGSNATLLEQKKDCLELRFYFRVYIKFSLC